MAKPERPRPELGIDGMMPPRRATFGDMAHEQFRDAILTTRLLPGTAISENDLAAATGVASVAADHARMVRLMRENRHDEAVALLARHLDGLVVDHQKLRQHSSDHFVA